MILKNSLLYFCLTVLSCFLSNYLHSMEIIHKDETYDLQETFIDQIKQEYSFDESPYFSSELRNDKKKQDDAFIEEQAESISLITSDNITLNGYFLDRRSQKALVIGQGFLQTYQALVPFFKLFPDYDIIVINYRWMDLNQLSYLAICLNPLEEFIAKAKYDAKAAVEFLKEHKHYDTITGIGLCYGGLVFTIAQAEALDLDGVRLFDKLIIDSCYYSTEEVTYSVTRDPKLCCENKHGGTPSYVQSILGSKPIMAIMEALGHFFLGNEFATLSMKTYLPLITNTPVFFIHGKKDLLVPYRHFESMYEATSNTPCCALITPYEHVLNHLKGKEVYAHMVDRFISCDSVESFVESLTE